MSWENDMAGLFQQAKLYKADERLTAVKAVVIRDSPLVLASHGGNVTYGDEGGAELVITQTVREQIQKYRENQISIVGKQIFCIGSQEFFAVSLID